MTAYSAMHAIIQTYIKTENTENMEKRNISITLEQAKEWYNSGNQALKEVALRAYNEEELTEPQTWGEIAKLMGINHMSIEINGTVLSSITKRQMTMMKLALIAEYLNKGWEPKGLCTKYFIGKKTTTSSTYTAIESLGNGYYIYSHTSVFYPGVVYFKTQEDAIKAFNMLKDEILAL